MDAIPESTAMTFSGARHLAAVFVLAAGSLEAQLASGVMIQPGAEVRLTLISPPQRVSGLLVVADEDSIRIQRKRGGAGSTFRFQDVRRIDVRGGEDKRRGFLIGGAILGGIGAVFGGIDYARDEISGGDYFGTIVANFLVGGLVGYVFAPKGWVELPLRR
jgi:hypothetical protein